MPFYFRKSFGTKGLRVNLSKTGIGLSGGVKGFRVSMRPKGTYVNIGGGGIYYRKKVGPGYAPSLQKHNSFNPASGRPQVLQPSLPPLPTAQPAELTDVDQLAVLAALNEAAHRFRIWWLFLVGGLVLATFIGMANSTAFWVMTLFAVFSSIIMYFLERERDAHPIEYSLDDKGRAIWKSVEDALTWLGHSQRVWRVNAAAAGWDYKTQGHASHVVGRSAVVRTRMLPALMRSNIKPHVLIVDGQWLIFLPDALYLYANKSFGAVSYKNLIVQSGQTRFVESDMLPSDAQVVDRTWAFVNKNGSPDRRFAHNREIPIALYGELHLSSPQGLNLFFLTSNPQAAQEMQQALAHARTLSS